MGGTWHTKAMFDLDSAEDSFSDILANAGIETLTFDTFGTGIKDPAVPFGNLHYKNVELALSICKEHDISTIISYSYGSMVAVDVMREFPIVNSVILDPSSHAKVECESEDQDKRYITRVNLLRTLQNNRSPINGRMMKTHINQMINTSDGKLLTPTYVDSPYPEGIRVIEALAEVIGKIRMRTFFTNSAADEVMQRIPSEDRVKYDDCTHWFLIEDARYRLAADICDFIG